MPGLCVATVGLYAYVAMKKTQSSTQRSLYSAAAVTTLTMVPFTWAVMAPTNNTLFLLEAAAKPPSSVEEFDGVKSLVVRWAWLHLFRAVFPFVGVFLGCAGIFRDVGL
jgi:hypothetical protein